MSEKPFRDVELKGLSNIGDTQRAAQEEGEGKQLGFTLSVHSLSWRPGSQHFLG